MKLWIARLQTPRIVLEQTTSNYTEESTIEEKVMQVPENLGFGALRKGRNYVKEMVHFVTINDSNLSSTLRASNRLKGFFVNSNCILRIHSYHPRASFTLSSSVAFPLLVVSISKALGFHNCAVSYKHSSVLIHVKLMPTKKIECLRKTKLEWQWKWQWQAEESTVGNRCREWWGTQGTRERRLICVLGVPWAPNRRSCHQHWDRRRGWRMNLCKSSNMVSWKTLIEWVGGKRI